MRFHGASALLLLLAPSLITAADTSDHGIKDAAGAAADSNVKKDGAADPPAVRKPYKITEDAPVDGLDGKPHQGPFVDKKAEQTKATDKNGLPTSTTTSKSKPTPQKNPGVAAVGGPSGNGAIEEIREKSDGVMNDANHVAPKKGTTGTEGGISETQREKTRLRQNLENVPQAPAEAPPLPHSEEQRIDAHADAQQRKSGEKMTSQKATSKEDTSAKSDETKRKAGADSGTVPGLKLEKPANLPDTPHGVPHPEPKVPTTPNTDTKGSSQGSGGTGESWLRKTMPYTEGKTNLKPNRQKPASGSSSSSTSNDIDIDYTNEGGEDEESWHEWFHSFVLSFTMIIFSEIGDKTFLVAALMAMRHPRLLVFSAALGALVVMTVLSAVLGHAVPTLLPQRLTTFAAAVLFLVFGARMLREGLAMPPDTGVGEEMKEVEAELEEQEQDMALEAGRGRTGSRGGEKRDFLPATGELSPPASRSPSAHGGSGGLFRPASHRRNSKNGNGGDDQSTRKRLAGLLNLLSLVLSPAWVQTFVMTFLGEWGDRSQIATIAMAAGQDYWWVTLGAIAGHAICTGVAVLGGRALAGRVSLRVVTIGGAVAFLVFGVIYLFECYNDSS